MKIPDGFKPVFGFCAYGEDEGKIIPGECYLESLDLFFKIGRKIPTLPIKAYGKIWHKGWDIPTCWAIDNEKLCWQDNAHGSALYFVKDKELLKEAKGDTEEYNKICKALGLSEEPEWMLLAKAAGWKPPKVKAK